MPKIDEENLFGFLAFLKVAAAANEFQACYTAAVLVKLGHGQPIPDWLHVKLVVGAKAKEWICEWMTLLWLYGRPVQ